MKNIKVSVLIITIILLHFSSCDLFLNGKLGYSGFQKSSLEEVNYLRTNPAGYAESRLLDNYQSGNDNGAYLDVKNRNPVGALTLNQGLCTASSDYAEYLADNDVFSHTARLTPDERAKEADYDYWSGENLGAGSYTFYNADENSDEAAVAFVEMLVIDQGVPSLGHRENLLSSAHIALGIGFHRNTDSTYDNYYVQMFGSR